MDTGNSGTVSPADITALARTFEKSKRADKVAEGLIRLDTLPPDVREVMKAFDTDGSGSISAAELQATVGQLQAGRKKIRRYKLLITIGMFFFLALLALLFGVIYGAVQLSSEKRWGARAPPT